MCFSYILDNGAEWKKYENTNYFNHIDVLNELQESGKDMFRDARKYIVH